ncbi:MAG: type II toxin-antitoxin system VapC family toxin [Bacteroidota bacterium]
MGIYLLDTNICIYILKQKPIVVLQKFQTIDPKTICISSITVAELMFGINKSSSPDKNLLAVNEFLNLVKILNFDQSAAIQYGIIKNALQSKGTPIGPLDTLIAAHAKNLNAILVSNNLKEFNRVDGLITENWIE